VEKLFGKNGQRPPFTTGIPLPNKGMTRLWMTKTTMESPTPS